MESMLIVKDTLKLPNLKSKQFDFSKTLA